MNLPPISMKELILNQSHLTTKRYREEFLILAEMFNSGKKMTALQKDQLVSYSWSIAYGIDKTLL